MTKKKTFEDEMTRLEKLVTTLEQNELGLDDSLKAFEEGTKLAAALTKDLEKAQERVRKLARTEQGSFELDDFEGVDEDQ